MRRLTEIRKAQELVYELKIGDAMETDILSVSPETRMSDLRPILRSRKITAAPVIRDDILIGIISVEDYINWLSRGGDDCSVEKCMSRNVVTLFADEPLVDAVRYFEEFRFYEFPVLRRKNGKMVGIITKRDAIMGMLTALDIDYQKQEIRRYLDTRHFFNAISADSTDLSLHYELFGKKIKNGGEAASKLKKDIALLGIHPDIIRRISIAVYEAEMNLIIYGGNGYIEASLDRNGITIMVKDDGPGIPDIDRALKPGFSTAPDWVRELGFGAGMGFTNIQNCAEKFSIESSESQGTCLRILFPVEVS
jgi:anti-sigma regulatory factor (Ser/Thr protein kinase)/CBS domain-containing protein